MRALADRIIDQGVYACCGLHTDQRAQWHRSSARIPRRQAFCFGRKFHRKRIGNAIDDDNPFGRHANLTLIHERTECGRFDRFVEVGIVEDDQRRFATEFEQARFQMLGRALSNDAPDCRRSGKVDPLDRGMIDQRTHDIIRVAGRVGHDIDGALGETRFGERFDNKLVRARARFRCFQNDTVAASERHRNRADTEHDGRIPRRNAKDHADGFAQRHGEASGLVRRNDLATDLRCQRRGFAHDACRQAQVEHCPAPRRADFVDHGIDEGVGFRFERIGGLVQDCATRIRSHRCPHGKCRRRPFGNLRHVTGFHCFCR